MRVAPEGGGAAVGDHHGVGVAGPGRVQELLQLLLVGLAGAVGRQDGGDEGQQALLLLLRLPRL